MQDENKTKEQLLAELYEMRSRVAQLEQGFAKCKHEEDVLRESEDRFLMLAAASFEGIAIAVDGRCVDANEQFASMLGCEASEVIGLEVSSMIVPEDRRRVMESIKSGKDSSFEHEMLREDGSRFTVEVRGRSFNYRGKQARFAVVRDITGRKKAEEALRESEERYRQIAENIREVFWMADADLSRMIYVSPAYEKVWGKTCQSLYADPKSWAESIHPDDRQRVMETIFPRSSEGHTVEYRIIHPDGNIRWVLDRGFPVRNLSGEIYRIAGIAEDITARKLAEQALRESEERYRFAMNATSDGVWDWNIKADEVMRSPCFFSMLGYQEEELESRCGQWQGLIHPDDRSMVLNALNEYLTAKRDTFRIEYRMLHKSGEPVWILSGGSVVAYDENGDSLRMVGTHLDITERKQAEVEAKGFEAKLRQSQKLEAIGTLAGGIAHDFNNILAGILGYTEMALTASQENTYTQRYLEEVIGATLRAKELVKQILVFSRQGEAPVLRPIEPVLIIKEALKMLRATLPTTIEFRQKLSTDLLPVMGDPTQLHQVLVNLCTNAAHAMRDRGGILEVNFGEVVLDSASAAAYENLQPGHYVRLTVSDTGHGMKAATLERIFDPYFTTKVMGEGSGLGLAVVHGIIQRHKGAIRARSEPGRGTIFEVLLPKIKRVKRQTASESKPVPRGTERILFVDDEETLAALGEQLLAKLGYKVTARTSSLEAVELFRSEPHGFDLVITDYTLPHMTGVDLAKEMMKIRPDIPIILCTGYSERVNENTTKELGIRAFVMKPLGLPDIARVIRNVLDEGKNRGLEIHTPGGVL